MTFQSGQKEKAPDGAETVTGQSKADVVILSNNGQVAMELAQAGLPVFPCGPDKRPMVKWKAEATSNPDTVRRWWLENPHALVGLPCGERSGIYVLDVDTDKATGETIGEESLAELGLSSLLVDTDQPRARTPSGGWHLFFRHADGLKNTASTLGRGLDTRGQGGYVIAPGSAGPAGAYEAERPIDWKALPEVPERLLLRKTEPALEPDLLDAAPNPAWGEAALAGEIERVRAAHEGERNDTLNFAATCLGQRIESGALDESRVRAALLDAARAVGLGDAEALATIDSGLLYGLTSPRKPAARGILSDWPEPHERMLKASRAAAPTLPLDDVFCPALADWVAASAEAKGAPADFVYGAMLASAASLIGNSRVITPWAGWLEPCGLWCMAIGLPSSGKSPAIDAAMDPLRAIERPKRDAAQAELKAYEQRAALASVAQKTWAKLVEKAIAAGKPSPPIPAEADAGPCPHVPRLVVQDTTIERLGVILEAQPKGALIYRDELAGWVESFSRYAGGGSDRPFWLEAYGGRPFSVERQTRASITIERLLVSIVGGIQPDRLDMLLVKTDDDGLLARFIPLWPEPVPVKRPTRHGDVAMMRRVLAQLDGLSQQFDDEGNPVPVFVHLDDGARDKLDELRIKIRQWETESEGPLLSFTGKLPGLSLRLALVLEYLNWAAEGGGEPPMTIDGPAYGRAALLVENYILPMARRTYAEASQPVAERNARRLVDMIREKGWRKFSSRDVLQAQRAGLHPAEKLNPVLALLEETDCIRQIEPGEQAKGGRPSRGFAVNPALLVRGSVGSVGFVAK